MEKNHYIKKFLQEWEKNISLIWEEINNFWVHDFTKNFYDRVLEIQKNYNETEILQKNSLDEKEKILSFAIHDIWNIFLE